MFRLVDISAGKKTAGIPAVYAARQTCPSTCPFYKSGCYALQGNVALHWLRHFDRYSVDAETLLLWLRRLPRGSFWRYGVAGDLPGDDLQIDADLWYEIVEIVQRRNLKTIAYTHKAFASEANLALVQASNAAGVCVNASCETTDQCELATAAGIPAVITVPRGTPKKRIVNGLHYVTCPAESDSTITCQSCGWCAKADRRFVVQLTAHGSSVTKTETAIKRAYLARMESEVTK